MRTRSVLDCEDHVGAMPATKISDYIDELHGSQMVGPLSEFRLRQMVKAFEAALGSANPEFAGDNRLAILGAAGIARYHLGNFDKALAHYNEIRVTEPRYRDNYHNIAFALTALGRYSDAIETLMMADPTSVRTLLHFANVLSRMGQMEDARDALEDAIQKYVIQRDATADTKFDHHFTDFDLHFWCAMIAAQIGTHVEACEFFARAICDQLGRRLAVDVRAIDFINSAPESAKRCLGFKHAAALVGSIYEMSVHGDQLLEWHSALMSLPKGEAQGEEYYEHVRELYEEMAPLRARAMESVGGIADGSV
jgi:tetratricopeptide (TPR) repeat protein